MYAWRRHRELKVQTFRREEAEAETARLVPRLESALADVSLLRQLLPICSSCKRVRDERGDWSEVGIYMENHYRTRVDTGLCPECAKGLYGSEVKLRTDIK
jgi:hypothetical protein